MGIKKSHASKKKKASWRKNVNIDDVEIFLEDKRLEERLGLNNPMNNALFMIDTKPSNELISKQLKKEKILKNSPKCFEFLKPLNSVPDPISKRNIRTTEKKRHPCASTKGKSKTTIDQKKIKNNEKFNFSKDVWGDNEKPKELQNEWIEDVTAKHVLKNTERILKMPPKTLNKKTSYISAIKPPHPGLSYNPSYKDHQNLLKEVAEREEQIEKKDIHLNRVTKKIFKKISAAENNQLWMKEMSQGLFTEEKNQETIEEKTEGQNLKIPVKNKKKDIRKRIVNISSDSEPEVQYKVVGGENAEIDKYPYQLALLLNGKFRCGASIIAKDWGITAVHCVQSVTPARLILRAGSSVFGSGGTTHNVIKIIKYRNYNPKNGDGDIALLKVGKPFAIGTTGVNRIALSAHESILKPGEVATVTGWGAKSENQQSISYVLQVANVTLISNIVCNKDYQQVAKISDLMVCAGDPVKGGKDTCSGDSGGPLVLDNKLIGITSWGYGCGQANYPGVYVRVAKFLSWIRQQINNDQKSSNKRQNRGSTFSNPQPIRWQNPFSQFLNLINSKFH